MTTSRIVRGTKGRVFLYICAVLFVTGLIACYNNVRVQLDDTHKSFDLCRKEQENLSTQLQVIYDYKQRLEKSLKTEKGDHQRTKNDLEARFNEEKIKNDKNINDAKLRFSTLQQHYNLLQTQHDDFKEECSKIQRDQLDEINNLQSKLKEVQEHLKMVQNNDESSIKHLKTQNELLRQEKEKLQKSVQGIKSTPETEVKRTEIGTTHFSKQIRDGEAHYRLEDTDKSVNYLERPRSAAPEVRQDDSKRVIAAPGLVGPIMKASTAKTMSAANIDGVAPLILPTVTPETLRKSSTAKDGINNEILQAPPHISKKIPEGVVPIPNKNEDANDFMSNNRYGDNDLERTRLKNTFHEGGDDNAKEEMDIPVFNNNQNNKLHIDDLAAGNKEDPEYDGQHLQEEDDDAVDGDNPEREQQDPAIRN